MSIAATELEILQIMKDKNNIISMKEISSRTGFEIGYTYMLCRSLAKQDYIGFFSPTSCRITVQGKRLVK